MVTVGEMFGFTKRFNEIVESDTSEQTKTSRLSILMTDLEQAYNIPMLNNEKFNKENPFVIQLYRAVSEARTI